MTARIDITVAVEGQERTSLVVERSTKLDATAAAVGLLLTVCGGDLRRAIASMNETLALFEQHMLPAEGVPDVDGPE